MQSTRVRVASPGLLLLVTLLAGSGGRSAGGSTEMAAPAPAPCRDPLQGFEDCNHNGIPDDVDIEQGTSTDHNGNNIPDECDCVCDINQDGVIGIEDLLALLAAWGPCDEECPPTCPADVDFDCVVGITDLVVLLSGYSCECP